MAANMACAESPSGAASVAEASRLDLKLRVSEDVWTGVTGCGKVEASGPSTCKNSSNPPPPRQVAIQVGVSSAYYGCYYYLLEPARYR